MDCLGGASTREERADAGLAGAPTAAWLECAGAGVPARENGTCARAADACFFSPALRIPQASCLRTFGTPAQHSARRHRTVQRALVKVAGVPGADLPPCRHPAGPPRPTEAANLRSLQQGCSDGPENQSAAMAPLFLHAGQDFSTISKYQQQKPRRRHGLSMALLRTGNGSGRVSKGH